MNEMIKIDFSGEQMKVSGRELHEFLEVKARYNDWVRNMIQLGFTENTDYYIFSKTQDANVGGRPQTDTIMTIEMAKEICMVTRNEKGKVARQYFLQIERDWNSPDKVMARALKMADATIAQLTAKIEDDKPKVEFADALLVCENCIYIEELAKLLCQIGMNTGRNRLFEEMASDGFLCIRNGVKNMPTQKCVENGWLVIEKKVFERGGKTIMGYTTKVTPKGIQYFIGYYKRKHGLEPLLTTSRRRVIEQRPAPRQLRAAHNQTDMR